MAGNNTGGSFLDKLLGGIKQIARNFVTLPQRPTLNFIGFPAVVDNPSMGTTDVYGTSGSTGGGITIIENNGAAMPAEPALNFVGFVLGDDPGNSRTNVSIPAPGTTAVANGGTGRTSLTSHAVLLGEGGSPVGFAVPTSAGFILTDHGPGVDPTFAAPPSGLPGGTGIVEVTSGIGGVLAIPLDVPHGGTGDVTLPNHSVLLGKGTSAIGFAPPTSAGFVLTDNGPGLDPSFGPAPGGFPTPTSAHTDLTWTGTTLAWEARRPVNDIRSYGAVGNNAVADRTGINSAMAHSVINGYPTYIPPTGSSTVAWLTDQQLAPPPGITVFGDDATPDQCRIKASTSSIASVWVVHNTDAADATVTALRNVFRSFTIDGAGLTAPCFDEGSFLTRWECVTFENGPIDGERSCRNSKAGTLSSVTATVPGGSPSGVTVSQLDPRFLFLQTVGATHIVLKVAGGGTGFVLSIDNGVTFALYQQRIVAGATVNLLQTSGTSALGPIGIRITFPAGTYHDNDTYAFTATTPTEDGGTNDCINTDNRYIDCVWQSNGTIYGTVGVLGRYSDQPRIVSISGTATTVAGSQVISIVGGTAGMSTVVREGDMLLVNNVYFGVCGMGDDGQVIVPAGATPSFSGSGFDYAFLVGAGRREDAGAENQRANIYNGRGRLNPVNFRFSGQHGPTVIQVRNEQFAAVAHNIGSMLQQQSSSGKLLEPHVEAGDSGFESIYIWPGTAPVRVEEPPEHWLYPSSASFGQQRLLLKGNEFGIAQGATSSVRLYVESLVTTPQSISAGTQIAAPSLTDLTMTTDIEVSCSGIVMSTAAPFFTGLASLPDGLLLQLYNNSSGSLIFQHDVFGSSGIYTVGDYDTLGPRGTWRMRVKSGKAVVISRSTSYANGGGNDGDFSRKITTTTNSTPKIIYDWDVAGLVAGTNVTFDIVAQSLDGANDAFWQGWSFSLSSAAGVGTLTGVVAGVTFLSAGAVTGAWAISWGFDAPNQFFRIFVQGDNVNTVTWKIVTREMSAGT